MEKPLYKYIHVTRTRHGKPAVYFRRGPATPRKKGVPCDLTLEYLFGLAEQQGYRCALTGIEFFAACDHGGRVDPYIPSIDRIVPSAGYMQGNVRLTVFAVNAMLLDWGEDVFKQVANSFRYWQAKR